MRVLRVNNYDLCVVMPVFNESECIKTVIASWHNELSAKNINFNIIIINDCSTDDTSIKLAELQENLKFIIINNKTNRGHGASLIKGYCAAIDMNSKWIFHVDSDNQFLPEDFSLLWNQKNKSDFIIGLRANRQDGVIRFFITKTLLSFLLIIFQTIIKDANSPYRLIKTHFLKRALKLIPSNTFAPNIFLSVIAKQELTKIIELNVTHLERQTGTSSIIKWKLIKACLLTVKQLILLRIFLLKKEGIELINDQ
jgi:glycosyltransferase involved in cell wall biosynthesis